MSGYTNEIALLKRLSGNSRIIISEIIRCVFAHGVVVDLSSDRRRFSTDSLAPSTTCLEKLSSFQMACGASKSADQVMYGCLAVFSTKRSMVIHHSSTSRFTRKRRRSQTPHIQSSSRIRYAHSALWEHGKSAEEARLTESVRANICRCMYEEVSVTKPKRESDDS